MKPVSLPEKLDAPRIELRKHEVAQAASMFRAVDHDRARLRTFLPWVGLTRTVADERAYIQSTHDQWNKNSLFDYSLFLKSDGAYLGNAGIHTISWANERCEIGYWILGRYEGNGYVTEAVLALERAAFDAGFHRVEIRCSSLNARSAAVPRRAGYRHEGTLRENVIELSRFRDTLVFGKLRTD